MKKILLVDDEEAICTMLSEMLKGDNRTFVKAFNGTEAQEMLEGSSFDLVISDVIMPDCDGIELMMAIRSKRPDVPVIIFSGGGRVQADHYLKLAKKLGAASVFEKPFEVDKIRNAVADVLGDVEAGSVGEQEA